jgi:protein subunit release factor B
VPGRRSQHKNKAKAWDMLRARLYEAELKKREEKAAADQAASKTDIGWGHQIRSYVLQPYQMVKDLRTGVESTSPSMCSMVTSTISWKPRSTLMSPMSSISTDQVSGSPAAGSVFR